MESIKTVSMNIKRLRDCRGLSQAAVAEAAHISRQAFIDIEKGNTKEPRVSNLQAIANAFDVDIVDLFVEPPELRTVRFRSKSIKTKKDKAKKEQYLVDAAWWLRDFNFLQSVAGDKKDYKLGAILKQVKKADSDRVLFAAGKAREVLGLRVGEPIGDIVGLMESAGVKIKLRSFDLQKFFGFSISESDGGPAIIVNNVKAISFERQIFTVAHELGHLILHPYTYGLDEMGDINRQEGEADRFAGYFLMPQEAFDKKLKESYGLGFIDRVLFIKRFFRVSYQTVLRRLSDMKIADYRTLVMKFHALYKNKYGGSLAGQKEPFGLDKPDFVEDYLMALVRKALD